LALDITGACEAENQLEVVFDPSLPDGAPRGILGPVWLREQLCEFAACAPMGRAG
jgi:hypothetical protein